MSLINQVTVLVPDIARVLGLGYTTIEIWEAKKESINFASEITGSTASAALVTSAAAATTFRVGGATLKFVRNGGAEQSVTFSAVIPDWTPAQVRDTINLAVPGAASLSGNAVVLTSTTTGRAGSIQVTATPTALAFPLDVVYGRDARIALVAGQIPYVYNDVAGTTSSRYKWRYSANGVAPVSDFSAFVDGQSGPIPGVLMSYGTARFVSGSGRALKKSVLVAAESDVVQGVALDPAPQLFTADENGYIAIPMMQGARLRVAIENSGVVRTITVPATPSFDLLQAIADAPDTFTVQTTPPQLNRRSI